MAFLQNLFGRPKPALLVATAQTRRGLWRWRVVDHNGQVVALSPVQQNFRTRAGAWGAGEAFAHGMGAPDSVMEPEPAIGE